MLLATPLHRRAQRLTLLGLALLLLCTALSGQPARAEEFTQALDDSAGDFAAGNGVALQRIAVSNEQVGIADQPGALVLAPIGELPAWSPLSVLPRPRANHAVVSLGRHIYVIAGAEVGEDSFTDSAYGNSVNPRTGAFESAWTNVPLVSGTLFARPASGTDCLRDVTGSARSSATAASLLTATRPTPNDPAIEDASGFIYVIGGLIDSFDLCNTTYATPQVQIGRVVNGVITGWTTTPANNVPTLTGSFSGLLGASAVVVRRADKAYLYLIGGRTSSNTVSKAVFYTELDLTTGALKHPLGVIGSPWRSTAELPGPTGLFNHTAVWSSGTTTDPSSGAAIPNDAIFVAGGYTSNLRNTANANVYRADIGADGALTWESKPGLANATTNALEAVSIGTQGRAGMAGFSQGGQLYFLGGTIPGRGVQQNMVAGAHDGQLRLLKLFDDGAEYFLSSEGSSPAKVPPELTRAFLGVAVVPAVLPSPVATDRAPVAAWAFALGGSNTAGLPQDDIFYAELGGDARTARNRSSEGWYFSQYHDVRLNVNDELVAARVLAVEWTAAIDRKRNQDADLRIEFRTSRRLCTELSAVFQAAQDGWRKLPLTESGYASLNGANRISVSDAFGDVDAACLQYRVYFSQNGVDEAGRPQPPNNNARAATPKLLNVGLRTTRTGTRDLFIDSFAIGLNAKGQVNNFDLQIKNLSPEGREDTAINAGTGGGFPVVLCVARTDLGASPPTLTVPEVPITGGGNRVGCAPVYNYIPKENMTPDTAVYVTRNWQANFTNDPLLPGVRQDAAIADIRALFSKPGQYAVAAIIDPFGSVEEQGRTQNNRSKQPNSEPLILRFNVLAEGFDDSDPISDGDGNSVYLPLISR